jgi:hypothetical protein
MIQDFYYEGTHFCFSLLDTNAERFANRHLGIFRDDLRVRPSLKKKTD